MASASDAVSRTSLTAGAGGGAAAYVLGYLIAYVWQAPTVADALRGFNFLTEFLGGQGIPTWKGVFWLFYNAHFVPTRIPAPGNARLVDFIVRSDDAALGLLYVVVIALLVAAGIAVVRAAGAPDDLGPSALAGAQVVVGYLPLAVIGAVIARHSVADATLGPDLLPAVLLAGVVYPVVLGGLGGAIATRL